MVEINPFVQDTFGNALVLDAKVNFDDNSLVRQPEVVARRDYSQVRCAMSLGSIETQQKPCVCVCVCVCVCECVCVCVCVIHQTL